MNPSANANQNSFFGIKVSQPNVDVNTASNNELLFTNDYNTQTFYDNTGIARILLGLLPDGTYGMWVSAPSVDVTQVDPTIPGELVFNSNNQTYDIADTNFTEMPEQIINNGGTQINGIAIPHNLGYTPIIQAYAQMDVAGANYPSFNVGSYIPLPINAYGLQLALYDNLVSLDYFSLIAAADNNNVYITWLFSTSGQPGQGGSQSAIPIQYYLQNVSAN